MNRQKSANFMCGLLTLTALIAASAPANAQAVDETTITAEVVSSSRNTLTVRNNSGQYQLFIYGTGITKPATLTAGSQVKIISTPGEETGVRVASNVSLASATGQAAAVPPVVPPEVRRLERDIEREVRRFQVGFRAGVALDPELILIGVQAQVGPFFDSNLYFRPNIEFGFGEVTALFALNPELIYRLPMSSRQSRWSTYVGAGPGFNLVHQDFGATSGAGKRVDFSDFHSDVGLNIIGGIRYRSGMFTELKTSVYASSSPTLRIIVGYNF